MSIEFQKIFGGLIAIIKKGEYKKLTKSSIDVPDKFNWVRDVFEPLIVQSNADRNMIELVTDNPS